MNAIQNLPLHIIRRLRRSATILVLLLFWLFMCGSGHCMDVYVLSTATSSMPTPASAWQNSNIAGVVERRNWSDLNPQPGVYDFSYLDQEVANAQLYGKKIILRVMPGVNAPSWLYGNGVESVTFTTATVTTPQTMPVPWDATMLGYYGTFLTALGQHFNGNSAISAVSLAGPTTFSNEMYVPASLGSRSDWNNGQSLTSAWEQVISDYNGAFSQEKLQLSISTTLGTNTSTATAAAADLITLAGGRAEIQDNQLTGTSTAANNPIQSLVQGYGSSGTDIGFEMLSASSASAFSGTFSQAMETATAVGACYLEIYPQDVSAVPEPGVLSLALVGFGLMFVCQRGP